MNFTTEMLPHTLFLDSLTLRKDGPRGNARGLFGNEDDLGMLNRLTAEDTVAAAKEIIYGIRCQRIGISINPRFRISDECHLNRIYIIKQLELSMMISSLPTCSLVPSGMASGIWYVS
jgi:hypothetical protein